MYIVKQSITLWIALICSAVFADRMTDKVIDTASTTPKVDLIATSSINDGPYIFIKEKNLDALWLCQGKVKKKSVAVSALPVSISQCDMPTDIKALAPAPQQLEYQGDFPIVAVSDLHGQFDLMITLLTNNNIIDQQGNWVFGKGHFVVNGDVFGRGDKVTDILWFLYRLEQQAIEAGGKLHLLLGNHEIMTLNGDLRYLHKKYRQTSTLLKYPYPALLAKDTVLGAWLRSKSVLLKINNLLFVHGGVAPALVDIDQPLTSINNVFKNYLITTELDKPRKGLAQYLHTRNGPTWYRGYFKTDGASTAEVDNLLKHFKVNHIVVGHTSQKTIETRHRGKVIAIDSSIKRGKYGELLFIRSGHMWRGNLNGEKLALE